MNRTRGTALAIALVVTIAARAIPAWDLLGAWWQRHLGGDAFCSLATFQDLVLLGIGLLLAGSAPQRSGLRLGTIGTHRLGLLLVCGVPVLATALVYPNLTERPFAGASWSMWAISPLAQDLVFIGFLYGWLATAFRGGRRVPHALWLTAIYFALWHLPNLGGGMSPGFVAFQMIYTAVGLVVVGLSRHWTGSILFAVATHTVVNAIAWAAS